MSTKYSCQHERSLYLHLLIPKRLSCQKRFLRLLLGGREHILLVRNERQAQQGLASIKNIFPSFDEHLGIILCSLAQLPLLDVDFTQSKAGRAYPINVLRRSTQLL